MSEASVVASTLDSTLQRAARTRESYESEIANLSAEIMALKTAIEFLEGAIASHGAYEREEAERIAADKQKEKERREEEKRVKEREGQAIAEAERLENEKAQAQLEKIEREKAAKDAIKQEKEVKKKERDDLLKYETQLEYISSQQYQYDQAMEILKKAKSKKK